MAMFIMLVIALGVVAFSEQAATPQLAQDGAVDITADETRPAAIWRARKPGLALPPPLPGRPLHTAASNGSVNSMHDSYTPLGGMVPMLLMQLGEVVFGGVGCGLYGMLGFAILTVFIAGLMVGRTPEYLGKKIEPYEMKMGCAGLPGYPDRNPDWQRHCGAAAREWQTA